MSRAAPATDVFSAVAEPRRRDILVYLAPRPRAVGDIVARFGLPQPSVSKHLKVLRGAGLVRAARDGRHVYYQAESEAIRPIRDWAGVFERYWRHQLARVKDRAEGA